MQVETDPLFRSGMEFRLKLRLLMDRTRRSQEDIGRALGVSQSKVSRWVKGPTRPDLSEGLALSRLFGVDPAYLADDGMDTPPESRDLSEDERLVIELYRALREDPGEKMDAREALRRLRLRPEMPRLGGNEPPPYDPRSSRGNHARRSS